MITGHQFVEFEPNSEFWDLECYNYFVCKNCGILYLKSNYKYYMGGYYSAYTLRPDPYRWLGRDESPLSCNEMIIQAVLE